MYPARRRAQRPADPGCQLLTPDSLPVAERGRARAELQRLGIDALPILDKHGVITDIVFAGGVDVDNRKKVDIPVVMMAAALARGCTPTPKFCPSR